MRLRRLLFLPALLLLALPACRKNDKTAAPATLRSDIYAVGQNGNAATYWKNDSAVRLTNNGQSSYASGIAFSGSDVYIAGYEETEKWVFKAVLWKNGSPARLNSGATSAKATSVLVKGTDVYVVGYELNPKGTSTATYWKNGDPVRLDVDDETRNTEATDIAFVGSDVYIVGLYAQLGQVQKACYWKNGQLNFLRSTPNPSSHLAIATAGTDVYLAWTEDAGINVYSYYMRNGGDPVRIGTAAEDAVVTAIAVKEDDVYISGWASMGSNRDKAVARYWKNGTSVKLTDETGPVSSAAFTIALDDSDIYAGGWTSRYPQGMATCWKNGVTVYPADTSQSGEVNRIAVHRH